MYFRCLFIIRQNDIDNDLQPFCYKPFTLRKSSSKSNVTLRNFNDWYNDVLQTLTDCNYTKFDDENICELLSNPLFTIKTAFGNLYPCILIPKNKFIFGGLISLNTDDIENFFGTSVDFVNQMATYFIGILKKNIKIKMAELLPEFYNYIKIMCPYGTPVSNSNHMVEYFKYPDNLLKTLYPSHEKRPLAIDQIPPQTSVRVKDIRVQLQEIVTGIQHEDRNGEARNDIDIIGQIIISSSAVGPFEEIEFNLQYNKSSKFMSKCYITDLLFHPNCVSCTNCVSPVSSSLLERFQSINSQTSVHRPLSTVSGSEFESISTGVCLESPNMLQSLTNPNLHSLRLYDADNSPVRVSPISPHSSLLESNSPANVVREHKTSSPKSSVSNQSQESITSAVSRSTSVSSQPIAVASDTIHVRFKPKPSEIFVLLTYRLMKSSLDATNDNKLTFVQSLSSPDPPINCSYQLEDWSKTSEMSANIVFRVQMNDDIYQASKKKSSTQMEFYKLEVLFPFYNHPSIADVSKCSVSQGKLTVLEQNRNIMVWNIGSNFKFKQDLTLIGLIKFNPASSESSFVDNFCIGSNAYAQVNFDFKTSNISGLQIIPKSFRVSGDTGMKLVQKQECSSFNYKVWNSLGDCPKEATK